MSDKNQPVVHAVVPSAGRGTRFLPITKSVPKEMLPVVDRPSIEYIVREATDAGIEDILFVTRAGKQSIEDYFDAEPGLEADLEKAGKEKALEYVNEYKKYARVHSVRQGHPLGLGHAILQGTSHLDHLAQQLRAGLHEVVGQQDRAGGVAHVGFGLQDRVA